MTAVCRKQFTPFYFYTSAAACSLAAASADGSVAPWRALTLLALGFLSWGVTTSIGTPIDARNLLRKYHTMLTRAELPSYRFHDLRHSCASMLLAKHVPARVVMEVLGHSQISMTMDTYSHVMPTMLREAADKMEEALRAAGK